MLEDTETLKTELHALVSGIKAKLIANIDQSIETWEKTFSENEPNVFWDLATLLGKALNQKPALDKQSSDDCRRGINLIREYYGELAKRSVTKTCVVFGTSGWREPIGSGFSLLNVRKVVRAIAETMQQNAYLQLCGYSNFEEVKKAGILLLRDNRFLGETFMQAAMSELAAYGFRLWDAGECPTGVGSALLRELDAAASINFTPSHNPMEYSGLKFNPRDGGPADTELTSEIEKRANVYMEQESFDISNIDFKSLCTSIDSKGMFVKFVAEKSLVFDLEKTRNWLGANAQRIFIAIDFMHGSSRGYIQSVLGQNLMTTLEKNKTLALFNANDDYAFHGVKPEPSAENQKQLIDALQASGRELCLGVALDPDADRIRFSDAYCDIDMNAFAPIAYDNLLHKGLKGGVATSLPSSSFALCIARAQGFSAEETEVGFKNFRPHLSGGKVLMAYEESDGISFKGHTLEKCALAGFLAALDIWVQRNENLSQRQAKLNQQWGYFYPGKAGVEVKGVSVEAWQKYKKAVLEVLQGTLFKVGDSFPIGDTSLRIEQKSVADGLKLFFEDGSWILLRPSGTEPKFRAYYEVTSKTALPEAKLKMLEYELAATHALELARAKVS